MTADNSHDSSRFQANPVPDGFANVMSHASQIGTGVAISRDSHKTLTLANAQKSGLTASDFTFA